MTARHTITPSAACYSLAAYLITSVPGIEVGAIVFGLGAISAERDQAFAWRLLTLHMVDAERRLGSHVTTAALEHARVHS